MKAVSWFWQDLRYGLRGLRNDLPFALLAVFALALGIGATTVIFSVIDAVVLEPFPYRDAGNRGLTIIVIGIAMGEGVSIGSRACSRVKSGEYPRAIRSRFVPCSRCLRPSDC